MSAPIIMACPSPESFIALRDRCGWGEIDVPTAHAALAGSIACASLYEGERLIGFGRIVGDHALNYYLQDVIVEHALRGKGHGRAIVGALMGWLESNASPNATIGLMAAQGKDDFYSQFGFTARPKAGYGAGMTRRVGA